MRVFLFIALAGICATASAQQSIAGYASKTDISKEAKLDGDQKSIEAKLGLSSPDFASAKTTYTSGGSSPGMTLQKLSTGLGDSTLAAATALKMKSDVSISVVQAYSSYWGTNSLDVGCQSGTAGLPGCTNYADVMVMSALDKKGPYSAATVTDGARAQIAKKGMAYHAVWLQVVNHLSHAVHFSKSESTQKDSVAFVDKAWAYYAGETASVFPEILARKRAGEFGTCNNIPKNVLAEFKAARDAASANDAAKLQTAAENIVPWITAPLIQTCIRYLKLEDGKTQDLSSDGLAEAWSLCSAVLPQMVGTGATTLRNMIDIKTGSKINYAEGLKALEDNYNRMGVSKSIIGTFDATVVEGSNVCNSASMSTVSLFTALFGAAVAYFAAV